MCAHDARLQVLERADVLDDIARGRRYHRKQLAVLRPAHGDLSFQSSPSSSQVFEKLSRENPSGPDYRNLRPWEFFHFPAWAAFGQPRAVDRHGDSN